MPLVGIVVGALAGAAAWAVSFVAPEAFVVATAFGASIVLTGAIHLDGYLDTCDALFASVSPERRLAIFKDPAHGTYALAGFAVAAGVWFAALGSLPPAQLPAALAVSGGTARIAAVINAYRVPYGRAGDSAGAFGARPPALVLGGCAVAVIAIALVAGKPGWLAAAAASVALGLAFGAAAAARLGGVLVGDVYGAIIVAVDVVMLALLAVAQGH